MLKGFSDVRTKLFIDEAFLASVLASLEIIEDESVPVACTDGKRIFINPTRWNDEEFMKNFSVLLHEMLHVALEHPWISSQLVVDPQDQFILNCIGDVIINKTLKNQGYKLIDGALESFAQIAPECSDLDKIGINEQTIVWFYEEVKKRLPKRQGIGCGPQGGGRGPQGQGQQGRGQEQSGIGQRGKAPLPGGCYKPNRNEVERAEISGAVKAALEAGLPGKIAGELKKLIDKLEKTKTDWKSILRRYLNIKFHRSWTYAPVGRMPRQYSFAGSSVILPVLEKSNSDKLNLSLIVDSSGSISDDTLYKFACEIFSLLRSFAKKIRLIVCDAALQQDVWVDDVNKIPHEFKGRGGTLFSSAFKAISKKPWGNVLIVLTDGEIGDLSDLNKPRAMDVIWCVVNNEKFDPPFGRVVHLIYS
jgi:predicted metal-dependent peptidase